MAARAGRPSAVRVVSRSAHRSATRRRVSFDAPGSRPSPWGFILIALRAQRHSNAQRQNAPARADVFPRWRVGLVCATRTQYALIQVEHLAAAAGGDGGADQV